MPLGYANKINLIPQIKQTVCFFTLPLPRHLPFIIFDKRTPIKCLIFYTQIRKITPMMS